MRRAHHIRVLARAKVFLEEIILLVALVSVEDLLPQVDFPMLYLIGLYRHFLNGVDELWGKRLLGTHFFIWVNET